MFELDTPTATESSQETENDKHYKTVGTKNTEKNIYILLLFLFEVFSPQYFSFFPQPPGSNNLAMRLPVGAEPEHGEQGLPFWRHVGQKVEN